MKLTAIFMTKSAPDAHRSSAPRLLSFLVVLAFILAGCVRDATLNDQIPVGETPEISPSGTAAHTPAKSSATASPADMEQPFLAVIKVWNGSDDFGRPLTQPAQAVDGMLEQVYENVVVYAPAKHPDQAKLRPVGLMLGMLTTQPGPQKYGETDGMVFYPVSGDQGYHIPIVFKDFIDAHGGMEVAGAPIAEVLQYSSDTYRQCFTNYCLDYVTSAPDEQKVRMVPLGQMLLAASQNSGGSTDAPFVFSPSTVNLTVTAANPKVGSGEDQQISLQAETSTDHSPLAGVEASLTVYYPENKQVSIQFPATDSSGASSVTIPAEAGLSNGTVVPYQVCLSGPSSAAVCMTETYLVWGN